MAVAGVDDRRAGMGTRHRGALLKARDIRARGVGVRDRGSLKMGREVRLDKVDEEKMGCAVGHCQRAPDDRGVPPDLGRGHLAVTRRGAWGFTLATGAVDPQRSPSGRG
jgi:hypothetical protein